MLWTRFSLRLSLYLALLSFPSTLTSHPVPVAEKHPHSMMLPPHLTIGMELCRWWAVPGFLQTWHLELRFIRQDIIGSHSPLGVFLQIPSVALTFVHLSPVSIYDHGVQPELPSASWSPL